MEPVQVKSGLDRMFTIEEMIDRFPGTSRGSWAQLRYNGRGPRWTKVGKRVFYAEADVIEFVASAARTSTAAVA